jgi:hypothetical protein
MRYTRIPNEVFELLPQIGPDGLAVYSYICYRSNPRTRSWCFETLDHMAERLRISRKRLQRVLSHLAEAGILDKRRSKHGPTRYRPADPQQVENGLMNTEAQQAESDLMKNVSTGQNRPNEERSLGQKRPIEPLSLGQKRPTNKYKSTPNGAEGGNGTDPQTASDFIKYCCKLHEEKYHSVYAPNWSRDGAGFKKLLKAIPPEQLKKKVDTFFNGWWESFWQSDGGKLPATIPKFIQNVNEVPVDKPKPKSQYKVG